eukprot:5248747-Pyramimonas_sp.AAC.1
MGGARRRGPAAAAQGHESIDAVRAGRLRQADVKDAPQRAQCLHGRQRGRDTVDWSANRP